MKKLFLLLCLFIGSASAADVSNFNTTIVTKDASGVLWAVSPTHPISQSGGVVYCNSGSTFAGVFIPTSSPSLTYSAGLVQTVTQSDGTNTYVTTYTYTGSNITAISCPIKQ